MATAVGDDRPNWVRTVLPLVMLVAALAAATVWFVALPALERSPERRTCEVIVLESGTTKCVEDATRSARSG